MALNANEVRSGISGEISVGLTSATAPATASATLTGFNGLGYISEDGLVPTRERSTNDIKAFQNAKVVRTSVTDAKKSYEFTLLQTNKATIEFAFGTTVTQTVTEGTYTDVVASTGGRKSFVFDITDGTNVYREYWAEGELTEMTPTGFVNGEAVAYQCTVVAYTDPVIHDTSLKS
jgi:hypothetical protein